MKVNISPNITAAADELKIFLEKMIHEKLRKMYLFGSSVRSDYESDSDVDILVLADLTETELEELNKSLDLIAAELSLKYNIVLSPILKNSAVFFRIRIYCPFTKTLFPKGLCFMDNTETSLANYRLSKSKSDLNAAEILLKNKLYSQSINRSYYAIFHAVRALLAFDKFDSKKHSGIIAYFN